MALRLAVAVNASQSADRPRDGAGSRVTLGLVHVEDTFMPAAQVLQPIEIADGADRLQVGLEPLVAHQVHHHADRRATDEAAAPEVDLQPERRAADTHVACTRPMPPN